MPRIRVTYQYPKTQPSFLVLFLRWSALSAAMLCFAWGAYSIYDQHNAQEEAELLFQQAAQDETPVPMKPDSGKPATRAKQQQRPPVAKLDIPRLGVIGYVEDGLDAPTLRKAIGHAPWSASAGKSGNVVLAAHRDTFFAGLRGVKLGDMVFLQEPKAPKHRYQVTRVFVVNPEDTWVMQPVANQKMLTMITCYPFSFVGHAPQRLIVQAQLLEEEVVKAPSKAKRSRRNRI